MHIDRNRMMTVILALVLLCLTACDVAQLNNPYSRQDERLSVLYSVFTERPKHLDPAVAYNANEYAFIGQIYEPPYQYHYLKRPYELIPLTAASMPTIEYVDRHGKKLPANTDDRRIAFTDYTIEIKSGIYYQPHPAFAVNGQGAFLYHALTEAELLKIDTLADFQQTGSRELLAEDYVYQIKRLAYPKIQSPIAELMKQHIVGFDAFYRQASEIGFDELRQLKLSGVDVLGKYRYRIRINGKYPQFGYWLAMPFFAPMPWEADVFYRQSGLIEKNITLDWYPIGTGPYVLSENNPNRRMVLTKNPRFHFEAYPEEGESGDREQGLLDDAGKALPFIDKVVFTLEKETIPYWQKFLQGYYDASGIASDSFDQAVQFSGSGQVGVTPSMAKKGIQLKTSTLTAIYYIGFNMLDPVVGGSSTKNRKLRQAIAIAVDYEEFISIFMNGRGEPAQGALPPGIFGYAEGREGINPYVYDWIDGKAKRKAIAEARQLIAEAGYPGGIDPKSGKPLIVYFDTTSTSIDDRPRLNWFRKQFKKLGIKLVIRGTDYNRFQQKMRAGNAQIFMWGWNADYPDPENFFFLLYGPNGKVKFGGENAGNYKNAEFDRLFEKMRNMDNNDRRYRLIQQMQQKIRYDAPWLFGFYPKDFLLYHQWYKNVKPNLMANNRLKYVRIDTAMRTEKRREWNEPVFWPLLALTALLAVLIVPAVVAYRRRILSTDR
ncbi:MAG: ABC transporter substrate-binding protein [Methylomicrobium sp.]